MYLALCQRVARRAGIAGASSGKPNDVTGQPERLQLVCDYVAEAVREIETEHMDWTFMRVESDFYVEAGSDWLDVSEVHGDIMALNENSVFGRQAERRQRISVVPWKCIRELRETAREIQPAASLPTHVAVDPAGLLQFYPASRDGFVLRAEYALAPSLMTKADDVPRLPETHHDAIFWRALTLHYEADEADMLMRTSAARYIVWLARTEAAFLPGNAWTHTQSPELPMVVQTE